MPEEIKIMLETQATSLSEIKSFLEQNFDVSKLCYRGQSKTDWGLTPSVFHNVKEYDDWEYSLEYIHRCERDCHREFRDECSENDFKDIFEWLAFEQHHGSQPDCLIGLML